MKRCQRHRGFTLLELLVTIVIITILAICICTAGWTVYQRSALAVAANNIRNLSAGAAAYLADNNQIFWPYRSSNPAGPAGVTWWFGFEPIASLALPEGRRIIKPDQGPLGPYVPIGLRPDPSFTATGVAFKPKYQFGYIGIGYNVLLGGGWGGTGPRVNALTLPKLSEIVVFATSAQVNTFQFPASPKKPMIEEFYGLDQSQTTVHFSCGGSAMVGYADGSAGFLPMDETTRDPRAPQAQIGRFAPVGSTQYLR